MDWREPHSRRAPTPIEIKEELFKIEEANQKIAELTAQINTLTEMRTRLQQERDNRMSFISFFRRLPDEIVGEIATHCLDDGPGPETLSQICSTIRGLINARKSLWCMIGIRMNRGASMLRKYKREITCFNMDYLNLILERARPAPLTIILDLRMDPGFLNFFSTFSSHVKRLILVRLTDAYQISSMSLEPVHDMEFPVCDLSRLQNLEIAGCKISMSHIKAFLKMLKLLQKPKLAFTVKSWDWDLSPQMMEYDLLSQATRMDLSINYMFMFPLPDWVRPMPRLEELIVRDDLQLLNLGTSRLRSLSILLRNGEILRPSQILTSIEELRVQDVTITETIRPTDTFSFAKLTCLTIEDSTIFWVNLAPLNLEILQELALSDITVKEDRQSRAHDGYALDEGLIFGYLPSLKRLWMNELNEKWVKDFQNCPNLTTLRLTNFPAAQHTIEPLADDCSVLPQLEQVVVWRSGLEPYEGSFSTFLDQCKAIRPSLRILADGDSSRLQWHPFKADIW